MWVDLEMTGLQVETDTILEIAVIVTEVNQSTSAIPPHQPTDFQLDGQFTTLDTFWKLVT